MTDILTDANPIAREVRDIAPQLREARQWVKDIQAELNEATTLERDLRDEMEATMTAEGIRTAEAAGLQFQLKYRSSNVVLDENALVDSLARAGILEDFTKLDRVAAAKYGVTNGLPGVAEERKPYLSVSEVKA